MSCIIDKLSPSYSFNSTLIQLNSNPIQAKFQLNLKLNSTSTQLKPNSTQSIPASTAPQLNSTPTEFKLSFNLISNLIQPQLNLNLIQLNLLQPQLHPN